MDAFISLAGALTGVIVGGVISYIANWQKFKYEKQHEDIKRQTIKLEQIYDVLLEINRRMRESNASHMFGEAAEPKGVRGSNNDPFPFEQLEMLCSFYAPSLTDASIELRKLCQKYFELYLLNKEDKSFSKEECLNRLYGAYSEVENKVEEVKLGLSKEVQRYLSR